MTEYFVRKPQNVNCQVLHSEDDLIGSNFVFRNTLRSYPTAERLVVRRHAGGELIAELMTRDGKGPIRTVRELRPGGVESRSDLWLRADELDGTKVFIYRLAKTTQRSFRIEFFWSNTTHADSLPTVPGNIQFLPEAALADVVSSRADENEDDVGDGYHED